MSHMYIIQLTRQSRPITFLATNWTLADAKATAVSAIISTIGDPSPELTDLWMKLSNTISINSGTWPIEPHILAWMDGYISTSSIVKRMSFSRICATCFWRLVSSVGLQNLMEKENHKNKADIDETRSTYLTRFASHGVMYSRHRCFSSMLDTRKPWMHSSRNSNVK